jgi:hypothetical protein
MNKFKNMFNKNKYVLSNYNICESKAGNGDIILEIYQKGSDTANWNGMVGTTQYDVKNRKGILFLTFHDWKNAEFEANILKYIKNKDKDIIWNGFDDHCGFDEMFNRGEATKIQRKINGEIKTDYVV